MDVAQSEHGKSALKELDTSPLRLDFWRQSSIHCRKYHWKRTTLIIAFALVMMKYPETFLRNFADTSPSRITILPARNLGSRSPPSDQCTAVTVGCCRVTKSQRTEWEKYPRLFSQLANSLEQTDNCMKRIIPRKAWASVAFTNALYPRVETDFISLPKFTISSKIKDRISHGQINSCTRHEPFCGGKPCVAFDQFELIIPAFQSEFRVCQANQPHLIEQSQGQVLDVGHMVSGMTSRQTHVLG